MKAKIFFKVIFGLALVVAGALWLFDTLSPDTLNIDLQGWWALFVIIPCLYNLFTDRDKLGALLGIKLVFGRAFCPKGQGSCDVQTIKREGKNIRSIEFNFGKQQMNFQGEHFEGADVKAASALLTITENSSLQMGRASFS